MDELKLIMNKDGVFEQYKEPYMTIEVPTEEDFRWLEEAVREKRLHDKGCAYCRHEMDLETDGGGELDLVKMIPLPAINLTTGEKDKTAPPPYMALMFRAFEGELEDYVPIRCCPMCGRLLKEDDHGN